MKYLDDFLPGKYYHVFNHAVGKDLLFIQKENYYYFLQRYNHYILPVAETYAYCLMPNHFHLFIRFRDEDTIQAYVKQCHPGITITRAFDYHKFLMQQFSNFLNSYTKSFNKRFERKGALFIDYTKRVTIDNLRYCTNLVCYIHNNPVKHGFCNMADEWAFSSYRSLVQMECENSLERSTLLEWFNDQDNFISYHQHGNIFLPDEMMIEP